MVEIMIPKPIIPAEDEVIIPRHITITVPYQMVDWAQETLKVNFQIGDEGSAEWLIAILAIHAYRLLADGDLACRTHIEIGLLQGKFLEMYMLNRRKEMSSEKVEEENQTPENLKTPPPS